MSTLANLQARLRDYAEVKIAVSGGVDSMTLAIAAGRALGPRAHMFHAVSAAVPPDASQRVRQIADAEGWDLQLINAGEFDDPDYLRNPYRRCFHCKQNLYRSLADALPGILLSGANHDDLDDFRPGLQAAALFNVRHPWIECGIGKATIRAICRQLGYPELAALPASPCLSSRIQTGMPIDAAALDFVYQVETHVRQRLQAEVVRCRLSQHHIAIQLDLPSLDALSEPASRELTAHIQSLATTLALPNDICFEPYRMGSAFVEHT
jgi:uncharacterized protein